jgi:hypothetical protein
LTTGQADWRGFLLRRLKIVVMKLLAMGAMLLFFCGPNLIGHGGMRRQTLNADAR